MRVFIIALFSLITSFSYADQQTVAAKSSGNCSPNIIGNKGKVNFTCTGKIDKNTADRIVAILNEILKKQEGSERTSAKLDEILVFIRQQAHATAAVKAGVDNLQQQATLIRTLEVEVRMILSTEPSTVQTSAQTPWGLTNTAGLVTPDGQILYLVNDSRSFYCQQFLPDKHIFKIIFHPFSADKILGRKLDALERFTTFTSGYSGLLPHCGAKFVPGAETVIITTRVNGVEVAKSLGEVELKLLSDQTFNIDVSKEFSTISETYSDYIKAHPDVR